MTTMTIKIPDGLSRRLESVAGQRRSGKARFVKKLLEQALAPANDRPKASCYDLARDLCGSVKGAPKDLSSNPKHLAGFGR
jgi:predicted DNA-binding protein